MKTPMICRNCGFENNAGLDVCPVCGSVAAPGLTKPSRVVHERLVSRPGITAHQFATLLLQGPDLPILVPKVKEYDDDEENCCATPVVVQDEGWNTEKDEPCQILIIDQPANGADERPAPARKD